jgi:hypothetical protein
MSHTAVCHYVIMFYTAQNIDGIMLWQHYVVMVLCCDGIMLRTALCHFVIVSYGWMSYGITVCRTCKSVDSKIENMNKKP